MSKQDAADLFGGKHVHLAEALGMTRGAISHWPDNELTTDQADRVIGAAIRLGRPIPPKFLVGERTDQAAKAAA